MYFILFISFFFIFFYFILFYFIYFILFYSISFFYLILFSFILFSFINFISTYPLVAFILFELIAASAQTEDGIIDSNSLFLTFSHIYLFILIFILNSFQTLIIYLFSIYWFSYFFINVTYIKGWTKKI